MPRPRRTSTLSTRSTGADHDAHHHAGSGANPGGQEMASMYDYLAKIILLGPSGCGKSCLLHRFVKDEWRVLSSQTIGVEFASKIVKVGGEEESGGSSGGGGGGGGGSSRLYSRYSSGAGGPAAPRRKRIKLQLWDTAGTERFRSVSRSYYRGAAGALLVYDVANPRSFAELPTFLNDARALASPQLAVLLVGNKLDLAEPTRGLGRSLLDGEDGDVGIVEEEDDEDGEAEEEEAGEDGEDEEMLGASLRSTATTNTATTGTSASTTTTTTFVRPGLGSQQRATVSSEGRKVPASTAANWATQQRIPGVTEVSALSGDGVDELFNRLARTILTKIELGEIDPDDPMSGIQYGDADYYRYDDGGSSVKSGGLTSDGHGGSTRRRRRRGGWGDALRVGRPSSSGGGKKRCC